MATTILWYLRAVLGLGAIFTALSEMFFYPVTGDVSFVLLALVYGLMALFAALLVTLRGGGGLLGFAAMAMGLGLMAEGLPVSELYLGLPLSILWTSMAWHGALSGVLGLWGLRYVARFGPFVLALYSGVLGALLGLWGGYFWSVSPEALGYSGQALAATALFIAGHVILPKASRPKGALWVTLVLGALALAVLALQAISIANPTVIVLPIGLALVWLAGRAGRGAPLWPDIRPRDAAPMLAFPATALMVQAATEGTALVNEINAWALFVLSPLACGLFALALWRSLRPSGSG